MSTPTIPGVDREDLADALHDRALLSRAGAFRAADVAITHIAAHQEPRTCTCGAPYDVCPYCAADDAYEQGRKDAACDREHDDEWVEVDAGTWLALPPGTRMRQDWVNGVHDKGRGRFVHRDDLPDPEADAANALRDASWNVPRLADGSRPDPLPGLPEARDLLAALREAGWTVTRKGER